MEHVPAQVVMAAGRPLLVQRAHHIQAVTFTCLFRPEQAAHELFRVLRELDDEGVHLIWVEEPPTGPEWDGVRDRLGRAAASA